MANEVAYKPLQTVKETPAQIERIDNTDLYNYKDKGVEFQGFSKTKIGQNQYKLLRQEFTSMHNVFGWAASSASLTLTVNSNPDKNNFYITNLIIQGTTDTACMFLLAEVDGNIINLFYCTASDPDNNQLNINFKAPLPFTKQTLEIIPLNVTTGAPIAITGSVVINYYGYTEQKA